MTHDEKMEQHLREVVREKVLLAAEQFADDHAPPGEDTLVQTIRLCLRAGYLVGAVHALDSTYTMLTTAPIVPDLKETHGLLATLVEGHKLALDKDAAKNLERLPVLRAGRNPLTQPGSAADVVDRIIARMQKGGDC